VFGQPERPPARPDPTLEIFARFTALQKTIDELEAGGGADHADALENVCFEQYEVINEMGAAHPASLAGLGVTCRFVQNRTLAAHAHPDCLWARF
jgi:hypothetical protein